MTSQQIIGRYEVLEELGHGAMGTVYRAKDPAMDRVVALKTIRPEVLSGQQGNEFRERFYREARAAGALAHPDGWRTLCRPRVRGLTRVATDSQKGKAGPLARCFSASL
jgi:serine/threonine protein kinase